MALLLLNTRASTETQTEDGAMLKITKMEENATTVVLKLEGKVTEQWAALLEGECVAFLQNQKTLLLDCAGVNFLDAQGVDVLRKLRLNEVTIIGAPGIVTELLQTGGQS
jgi:anti-anti-sigma regulatory factor